MKKIAILYKLKIFAPPPRNQNEVYVVIGPDVRQPGSLFLCGLKFNLVESSSSSCSSYDLIILLPAKEGGWEGSGSLSFQGYDI